MKITCYGPRGSIPSPSTGEFSTVGFGGDTSCYYVEAGPFRIILDFGSGARALGNDLMRDGVVGKSFIALLSHYHWDHVQGLPFCAPLFVRSNDFHVHGHLPMSRSGVHTHLQDTVERVLSEQQATPHFPVALGSMPSTRYYTTHAAQFSEMVEYGAFTDVTGRVRYQEVDHRTTSASKEDVIRITTLPLNHPDGCLGYRIDYMGRSVTYCTDTEPYRATNAMITKLAKGTDLLIMDGQHTEEQLGSGSQGFGHGTPRACLEQAVACGAAALVVHHHDPAHNDARLTSMEAELRMIRDADDRATCSVEFARQGVCWTL